MFSVSAFLLIFISIILGKSITNEIKNNFIDYGIYCGYLHTSEYGLKPIDILDRYCQIHDICTSVGIFDCYCNEQLYWSISQYKPINTATIQEKNNILHALYGSLFGCENFDTFDLQFKIGSRYIRGFNYFTFFSYTYNEGQWIYLLNSRGYMVLKFNDYNEYLKFTYKVYNNNFDPDTSTQIDNPFYISETNPIIVIYNNSTEPQTIYTKNLTQIMNSNYYTVIVYIALINTLLSIIFFILFVMSSTLLPFLQYIYFCIKKRQKRFRINRLNSTRHVI